MTRIAYVNGQFLPQDRATVMMEDRGYQFADGIYEVAAFINRRLLDLDLHLNRLERSLAAIKIAMPMTRGALKLTLQELMRKNARESGLVYLQVTRGVAARQHTLPADMKPVVTMTVLPVKIASDAMREKGAAVMTAPDLRWKRCDIKSIALLPNILARAESQQKGLRETFFVNDTGFITEGTATNVFIVNDNGQIYTHPKSHAVLPGVTRDVVVKLARDSGFEVVEEAFSKEDLYAAREVFFTSTSTFIMPVVEVDKKVIGAAKPGDVAGRLIARYKEHVKKETGQ